MKHDAPPTSAPPRRARSWTRIDDYLHRRSRSAARRRRSARPAQDAEPPRFLLSMLPFIALLIGLAVMTVAIFAAAWPGGDVRSERAADAQPRPGTAEPGWYREAQREMR